jgi:alpha-L-fucosidase
MRSSLLFALLVTGTLLHAQENVHPQSTEYEWPKDEAVLKKLDHWRDQKFGMIIHWGLYAVPGIIESWSICSEDWIERDSNSNYGDYKKWYWGLKKDFNPVNFNPDQWANAAEDAGMKYVVFTTKHHDGFCMFDTKQTDFNISAGPFATNPKADVAKYVFDAFRKKNFMIGAYFSKPDWHCPYYWWPKYATPDRNVNYDIRKYPWRWNEYKSYTYNQLRELMTNYGSMDILWLDGGWVRPLETVNDEVRSWGAKIPPFSQDIDMPSIAAMARNAQPGVLIVDRTVHGPYENYQTPEQKVPDKQLDNPWESCMTLANNWGYVPNDHYKTPAKVIHTLIEIVAKGGSLLLGVGPKPDGTLTDEAIQRLEEIGKWMKKNGEAIYNTRTLPDYKSENIFFTRNKEGKNDYALVCLNDAEIPAAIEWTGNAPAKGSVVKCLSAGSNVKWKLEDGKTIISLTPALVKKLANQPAITFSFVPANRGDR